MTSPASPGETSAEGGAAENVAADSVPRLAYQPALDGLRALAVMAVILYHDSFDNSTGHLWARGGSLGVDVFFVLSGFLITSLLLIDHRRTGSTISRRFWARRFRRLLPALLVLVLITATYAFFFAESWELTEIRRQGFAALLYVENWYLIFGDTGFTPFSHTWSLAIEEQWYLIWPVGLAGILLLTRGRPKRLLLVILVLVAASATAMAFLYSQDGWGRAYNGTETRAFELLIGAGLGVLLLRPPPQLSGWARRGLEAAGLVSLVFLGWAVATTTPIDAWMYRGGFLLVAIAAAVLITACTQPSSRVLGPVLSWRPLVATGLISYGLYLYHVPIFDWLSPDRIGLSPVPLLALRLAVVFAFAALSYFLIEMPVRRGSLAGARALVVAPIAVLLTVAVLIAATQGATAEPPLEWRNREYRDLSDATPAETTKLLVAGDVSSYWLADRVGGTYRGKQVTGVTATAICGIETGNVVLGDTVTQSACDEKWRRDYRDAVESFQPDVVVLMVGQSEMFDREVGGQVLRVGTPELAAQVRRRLDAARRILGESDARLVVASAPCGIASAPDPLAAAVQVDAGRRDWSNEQLRTFARRHGAEFVNLDEVLCPDGSPAATDDGRPLRTADGAFTEAGAEAVWDWLAPVARRADDSG